jgi:hypothetical protein
MFNNLSNCEITVNNYSNSLPPPPPNNNNKRKNNTKPLESFGFKRQSAETPAESIIQSNWDLVLAEKKQTDNNNNNNNKVETDEIKRNSPNSMQITMDSQISIKPARNKMDWLRFPHLVKIIHKYTQKFEFNYRKAAEYCNFHFSDLFLDYPISFATIQTWYIENPELKTSNAHLNCNQAVVPQKKVLKQSIFQLLEAFESNLARKTAGKPRIFASHLYLETEICNMIAIQRKRGTPINSIIARNLIFGLLQARQFEKLEQFGGKFKCSRSWVRKFLAEYCWLTYRRSTNAAQKLPNDAESQCEAMVERIAILAEKYAIPADLLVNCGQTGLHYIPKSRYTYAPKGARDVSVVGEEDKRQFTAVAAVSASNELLPMQLVYPGKPTSTRALPELEFRNSWKMKDLTFVRQFLIGPH